MPKFKTKHFLTTMKKYFLLTLFSILLLSCSKGGKVIITGNISGGSPLERLELIETSGIATLPINNIGVDAKGNFSDTLEIPKNGVYVLTYAGRTGFLYLKGGDKVEIKATSAGFPADMKVTGDAKNNTEYLTESQRFVNQYLSKLDQSVITKDETAFLKDLEKYKTDISKKNEEIAKIKDADNDVKNLNKDELDVTMLMISSQYANMHGQATNNPNYKPSAKFLEYQKGLEKESFISNMPTYRNYVINKLMPDFQKYASTQQQSKLSNTEIFSKFLDTKKELSEDTKDHLLAMVAAQFELQPNNPKVIDLMKFLNGKLKNEGLKADLKKVEEAIIGLKQGTDVSSVELVKQDGKETTLAEFKGKPTLVVFYASWNPYINENAAPILKEIVNFYKSKMNFALVDLDDSQAQFVKTSKALFSGLQATNVYGKGGMSSEVAKKFAIYGFKMPSFIILDKDGKVASKAFLNIGDPALVTALNNASGLQAPAPQPAPNMPPPPPVAAPAK